MAIIKAQMEEDEAELAGEVGLDKEDVELGDDDKDDLDGLDLEEIIEKIKAEGTVNDKLEELSDEEEEEEQTPKAKWVFIIVLLQAMHPQAKL